MDKETVHALRVMQQLGWRLMQGLPVDDLRPVINLLTGDQEQRATLALKLSTAFNIAKLPVVLLQKQMLMGTLLTAIKNDQLTPAQTLDSLELVSKESNGILTDLKRIANPEAEAERLLDDVDITIKELEAKTLERYGGSTPQSREIMRRLAYRANKLSTLVHADKNPKKAAAKG